MRTTLTLDDDVAIGLERLRRSRNAQFKALVNEVLRLGLRHMNAQPTRGGTFHTTAVDLGRPRLPSIDNVSEVLAATEGEAFR